MSKNILERLIEHNNWANLLIIRACSSLSSEQWDADPHSATRGNIRTTLLHLLEAQQGYLQELSTLLRAPYDPVAVAFENLEAIAVHSGDGLLAVAREASTGSLNTPITTKDGEYRVEPWVILLQAINHATEHREQIKSMLSSLGVTPPRIDGWAFGRTEQALVPVSK